MAVCTQRKLECVAMPSGDGHRLGGSKLRSYFSPFEGQVHFIMSEFLGRHCSFWCRFPTDEILLLYEDIWDKVAKFRNWNQNWTEWLRPQPLQPCQFFWKLVQRGLLPILLKYNPPVTLYTFPFLFFVVTTAKTAGQIFMVYTSNNAESVKVLRVSMRKNLFRESKPLKPRKSGRG